MTLKEEKVIAKLLRDAVYTGVVAALTSMRVTTRTKVGERHETVDSTYQRFEELWSDKPEHEDEGHTS